MQKRFKRVGAKSVVIMVRVSESMDADLNKMQEMLQMSKSDFIRIAVSNAVKFYSKKHFAAIENDTENAQFLRDAQMALKKNDEIVVPSDDEIDLLVKQRQERLNKKPQNEQ